MAARTAGWEGAGPGSRRAGSVDARPRAPPALPSQRPGPGSRAGWGGDRGPERRARGKRGRGALRGGRRGGRGAGASGRTAESRRQEPPPTRSLRGRSCSLPGATVTQHACQVGPRPDGSHYPQLAFGVSRAATGVVTGLLSSVNSLFLLGPLRPGVGGPARCASDFFIYTSRKT